MNYNIIFFMQHNIGGNQDMAIVKAEQKSKVEIEKEIEDKVKE